MMICGGFSSITGRSVKRTSGEKENRKAPGILSNSSPFWTMGEFGRDRRAMGSRGDSNVIELTREEWEARKRSKMPPPTNVSMR
jgi:hypothetical protein